MAQDCCEAKGCSLPGTVCPACQRCFCWQHLQRSSCEVCRKLVARRSFEYQFSRLISIGLTVLLCGILLLLLPQDASGIIVQLAIALLIGGSLLFWLGLLARS
ncbi:MAG TPA: hypothetical protein VGU68_11450 [Ktedonobacteraceae bacterium]|nr:hypothetical protein [Ktedonobacteraceae bacterium]